MGAIGKCCCPEDECVPCEEQADLESWAITSPVLDFEFEGEFGELIDTGFLCSRCGTECKRDDNIEVDDEFQAVSAWGSWQEMYTCGPCVDCTNPDAPGELAECFIDLVTGITTCPSDHPNYDIIQQSSRNGFRVKFWFSKIARARVCVQYLTPTTVKFVVDIDWKVNIAETSSYGVQRRWRTITRQCTTNNLISEGTPNNDGAIDIPDPLAPCVDILDAVAETVGLDSPNCPEWTGESEEPDPCESETVTAVTTNPCVVLQDNKCVTLNRSEDLVTSETRACCDIGLLCAAPALNGRSGSARYDSEIYECDEVPGEIELTRTFSTGGTSLELEFFCNPGIDTPDPIPIEIPDTLTLTVA